MPLPREYWGIWRRISLSVQQRPASEDSEVLWLQTRSFFADLRTALRSDSNVPISAFSGRVSWEDPEIRFHRDFDLTSTPVDDCATLQWREECLIERGVFRLDNRLIPYEEIWVKWRRTRGARRVLDGCIEGSGLPTMRWVEIDGMALAVLDERPSSGTFTAVQFVNDSGVWHEARRIGKAAIKPLPQTLQAAAATCAPDEPLAIRSNDPIWGTRTWFAREYQPADELNA